MKILFDECVPWPVRHVLPSHDCQPVQQMGWAGIKNGSLLNLAEGRSDLFLTSDQNLRYQQNLQGRQIAILQLSTNKLNRILAATVLLVQAIETTQPGEFRILEIP